MGQITVAIHTYGHAIELKQLLETEGIPVVLQNVDLENPGLSAGMRVRINQTDLPLALRIIENRDIFTRAVQNPGIPAHSVLVPVDCTECSLNAVRTAAHIAFDHKLPLVLIHAYIDPLLSETVQLSNALIFDIKNDSEKQKQNHEAAVNRLAIFSRQIAADMAQGKMPHVEFIQTVVEGVPEDVIRDFTKNSPPYITVMGTRDIEHKRADMIGSVTAETIDKTRCSVMTIPENSSPVPGSKFAYPSHILFISNLDQEDILTLDTMARVFGFHNADIHLTYIPRRRVPMGRPVSECLESLKKYCDANMPSYHTSVANIATEGMIDTEAIVKLCKDLDIDLIVIPHRRKSALSRLLNKGLPGKLLFTTDTALLVIRV